MTIKISRLKNPQLLALFADILETLRERGVVRSSNNPVADYGEGLCKLALRLKLNTKSTTGYDGKDRAGRRIEVKCRRLTRHNPSRQLSAIRGLEKRHFDFVAGILFDADFSVRRAALIPYKVVKQQARFVKRTNSWRLLLRDEVWNLSGVVDITAKIRKAQS